MTSADGGSVTAPKSQNGSLATICEVLSASKAAQPPSADAMPVIQVTPRLMAAFLAGSPAVARTRRSARTTSAVSSMSG